MKNLTKKLELLKKRKARVRRTVNGTAERPRLSVHRSAKHISAQVIDDEKGVTLLTVKSFGKAGGKTRANVDVCKEVGKKIAQECKSKGIAKVVFDKNGRAYHGRVKALAEGAREGGLDF